MPYPSQCVNINSTPPKEGNAIVPRSSAELAYILDQSAEPTRVACCENHLERTRVEIEAAMKEEWGTVAHQCIAGNMKEFDEAKQGLRIHVDQVHTARLDEMAIA